MLCPEVWKFDYLENNVSLEIGNFSKKSENFLEKLICKHPFNQTLSIAVAEEDSNNIPDDISTYLNKSFYYRVNNIKLTDLIRKDFIEAFIKRGKFTALNLIEFNEIDDIFAVTPEGVLILLINKDLFQSIGLDGRAHSSSIRKKDRYVVEIDLKNVQFHKKSYQRIKFALSNELLHETNIRMNITWEPPQDNICRSSLAKYFHDLGREVEFVQPKAKTHNAININFPNFSIDKFDKNDLTVYEFIECLNMIIMSCDSTNINEFLNISNDEIDTIPNVKIINCKGYFESNFIWNLVKIIRNIFNTKENIRWIALNINGFQESPINFYNTDHSYTYNGDNDYLIIFYKNGKFLLRKNICSNKIKK